MKASFQKYTLDFKTPSGTSRGILKQKDTWFLFLKKNNRIGIGECGMFRGLSIDDRPDFVEKLQWVCENIPLGKDALYEELVEFPSIQFGVEMAFISFEADTPFNLFPSEFLDNEANIPINGLIWMGDKRFMKEQILEKIKQGFHCIKMKIGAIDFSTELELLHSIRNEFSASDIELRVDANGAFSPSNALEKLKRLSDYQIHSIEQPIQQGQWDEMAYLCKNSPLAIALDEELIGVFSEEKKIQLLNKINPQYIILKPTLTGGIKGSNHWIQLAETKNIAWWITSALESNVGLNAISQYTFTKNSTLPQGLGTGSLFTNNIPSPLEVCNGALTYRTHKKWNLETLKI